MSIDNIQFEASSTNTATAYIKLPGFPKQPTSGCVARTIGLHEIIEDYKGPRVYLDFDSKKELIGIEILA